MVEADKDEVTGKPEKIWVTEIPGMPGLKVEDILRGLDEKTERERRICMCGHPVARHKEIRGEVRCQPSRMSCRCADLTPAVEVSNTRYFLRRTDGPGPQHALARGLLAAAGSGVSVRWLIEVTCSACGSDQAIPAGLTKTMAGHARIAWENPEATRLLCSDCIARLSA